MVYFERSEFWHRTRLEALGGPDEFAALLGITPATAEETLYVTECPWELVRSCTEDYSFTLYNKHTGDACRDYRGPAFAQESQPGTVGFALVLRHGEPDGGAR